MGGTTLLALSSRARGVHLERRTQSRAKLLFLLTPGRGFEHYSTLYTVHSSATPTSVTRKVTDRDGAMAARMTRASLHARAVHPKTQVADLEEVSISAVTPLQREARSLSSWMPLNQRNYMQRLDCRPTTPTGEGRVDKRSNRINVLVRRPSEPARLVHSVAETTSHWDREALDLSTIELLSEFFNAGSVALYALEESEGIRMAVLRARTRRAEGNPLAGSERIPLAEKALWTECVSINAICALREGSSGTETVFPIQVGQAVSGLLVVNTRSAMSSRHSEFVLGILRILQNHLALLEYGQRDSLTGLLNRKTFEGRFEKLRQKAWQKEEGAGQPRQAWLGLLDIDKFKSINDTYGHLFGDEVLLLTSQLMKRNFRGADQLFRFGGEEFLVILDDASEAGAQTAFERLRAGIETANFPQVGKVTISIGYTRIACGDTHTLSIERADAALYYAKDHGRNNVQQHEALVASGALSSHVDTEEVELF
jgi:diguanylate cyclase (GGDEF)-like protein